MDKGWNKWEGRGKRGRVKGRKRGWVKGGKTG